MLGDTSLPKQPYLVVEFHVCRAFLSVFLWQSERWAPVLLVVRHHDRALFLAAAFFNRVANIVLVIPHIFNSCWDTPSGSG